MTKLRIAVATKGHEGLRDVVSEVFGRASTFTIANVEKEEIEDVEILENPAVSYKHGAGPIVVKMLIDADVNVVLANEFGLGASTLLQQHKITAMTTDSHIGIEAAVRKALSEIEKR
jgi:predicted Fe-Mo cluster-binding NifX family protein